MNKKQALILIDKVSTVVINEVISEKDLHKLEDITYGLRYSTNNGHVNGVQYKRNQVSISVGIPYHAREIEVLFTIGCTQFKQKFKYLPWIFAYLSKPYRKTKKFLRVIDKLHQLEEKRYIKRKEMEELEKFHDAYCQAFPDEVNNILLGDDDAK